MKEQMDYDNLKQELYISFRDPTGSKPREEFKHCRYWYKWKRKEKLYRLLSLPLEQTWNILSYNESAAATNMFHENYLRVNRC
jgi:hypothetical protein